MTAEFIGMTVLVFITVSVMVCCMSQNQIEEMYRQLVGMVGVELTVAEPEPVLEWCPICDHVYESRWMEWHDGVYSCSGCAGGTRPPGHPFFAFEDALASEHREAGFDETSALLDKKVAELCSTLDVSVGTDASDEVAAAFWRAKNAANRRRWGTERSYTKHNHGYEFMLRKQLDMAYMQAKL